LALDTLQEKRETKNADVSRFAFLKFEKIPRGALDFRAVKLSPVAPAAQDAGSMRKAGVWLGLRHQINLIKPAGSDRKWEQQQQGQQ